MTLAVMALAARARPLRNIAGAREGNRPYCRHGHQKLRKLGATVEEGADFIRVTPRAREQGLARRQHPHL